MRGYWCLTWVFGLLQDNSIRDISKRPVYIHRYIYS